MYGACNLSQKLAEKKKPPLMMTSIDSWAIGKLFNKHMIGMNMTRGER